MGKAIRTPRPDAAGRDTGTPGAPGTPTDTAVRPRPAPDRDSAYWWEAVRDRRFLVQYCDDCRSPRFPPREVCAVCLSLEWHWRQGTGTGTVDGWTVTRRTFHPAFPAPYTVLRVALDDGPALYCWGGLVGADPADLRRGLPVRAWFTELPPEAGRSPGEDGPDVVVDWRPIG